MPSDAHLSIGEVLACLRPDFPDLTISKIRFYETAGLVEPARTPAGYRKFTTHDVERLRYVLTAKHDHYLPLRVIRDQLEAIDSGVAVVEPAPEPAAQPIQPAPPPPQPALPQPALDLRPNDLRLSREQMLAESGLTETALAAVDAAGLLQRRRGGYYSPDDVAVATIVAELGRFGLEPRHLRAFKSASDREVGLVEQAVAQPAARRRTEGDRERSRQTAGELGAQLVRLHSALLQAGLRSTLTP